jgi:hypothetical protein
VTLLSFSVLRDKIESGAKQQSNRLYGAQWRSIKRKLDFGVAAWLQLWWKSRSPVERAFLFEAPLVSVVPCDMHILTVEDAVADGATSLAELETFYEQEYGHYWRNLNWCTIHWDYARRFYHCPTCGGAWKGPGFSCSTCAEVAP